MPPFPVIFEEIFRDFFAPATGLRRVGLRGVAVAALAFSFILFFTFTPEPRARAKASLSSSGRWVAVPLPNVGPFAVRNSSFGQPDGVIGWPTIEDFLVARPVPLPQCADPKLTGAWRPRGDGNVRKYVVSCADRRPTFQIFFGRFRAVWLYQRVELMR